MSSNPIEILQGKKIYFASDFHLGAPNPTSSKERELKIIRWLEMISADAQVLFLVGDVFDFWFEYIHAIPKGSIRFLAKLAELNDKGIRIILFSGNHDIWYRKYLTEEMSVEIVHHPKTFLIGHKKFYVAHGDGLGRGGTTFKIIKRIFTNPICIWLFSWLHPDVGITLARAWSMNSKSRKDDKEKKEKTLIEYSLRIEEQEHHDYYVYGDNHKDILTEISGKSCYVNLGEWMDKCSYVEFDGEQMNLKYHA